MRGQATDLGTNWFLTRNLNFGREYLEKVQKVTLDDIKRVAIQYLSDENLTIVSLNPKGSLTSKSDVAAAVAPVRYKSSSCLMDCAFWCGRMRGYR